MIVLIDGVRYRLVIPDNEAALEEAIKSNFQHIFGPDSFYLDVKKLIKSKAGIASIPDGYVILFEPTSRWCILEVELASHPIYDHIIPQLTKFNRGIENSSSRKKIVDMFYSIINEDEVLKVKLKQKIKTGEIYKFISDLISENPLIVVAIDKKTDELFEAVRDIRGEVRVLEFQTFRREGIKDQINAYVFEPIVKSKEKSNLVKSETIIKEVSTRRGGIGQSIYELFDEKDIENVTYEECETLAKKIKPDTKFNPSHFSWYKNEYKRKRKERGTDKFGSRLGSNQAKINSEPIVTSLTALRLAYLKELSPKVKQEHIKLLIEIDKTHKHIFGVDWNHPGKELLVFGKSGMHQKPSNAAKELFGKDFLGSYGNIARKNGTFVDTSTSPVQVITRYADVEKHIAHLKKAGVIAATTEVDISVSNKSGAFFDSTNPHKQKMIIRNILQRRQLWYVFLKKRKMTSGEFKKLSKFKPHAIAGFVLFLIRNEIATSFADTFTLNEAVIPQIKELLKKY